MRCKRTTRRCRKVQKLAEEETDEMKDKIQEQQEKGEVARNRERHGECASSAGGGMGEREVRKDGEMEDVLSWNF
jgi:hypothetical protein